MTKDAASVGLKFGRLTVLAVDKEYPNGSSKVRIRLHCRCDCGNERLVGGTHLRAGKIISCGCARNEKVAAVGRAGKVHGHSRSPTQRHGSPTYVSWKAMLDRCTRPTNVNYARYGARGIAVCDRWASFANFLADMGPRPDGTTLDRVDGARGYSPDNCRWSDSKEQNRNRCNVYFTVDLANEALGRREHGESRSSVARRMGVSKALIASIERGNSWKEILPFQKGSPCRK